MNFNPLPQYPFIGMIISIIIVLIVSFILANFLSFLINKLTKKFNIEITLSYLLKDLVKYSLYIIAFIIILKIVGIDITAVVLSLGIFGISIGLAARDIISSFVSGIFILADKTVKVGEVIEVDGIRGRVKKLGFRTTTLVTPDNLIATIPNLVLSKNPYINYTYFDEHRIDLEIVVPYKVDFKQFQTILIQRLTSLNWTLKYSSPRIIVKEMVDGGIKLKISAWGDKYSQIENYRLNIAEESRKLINELSN